MNWNKVLKGALDPSIDIDTRCKLSYSTPFGL